jgi:hypothetical protein
MGKRRVCIVGGGATGAAMAWSLAQDRQARQEWEITLIHNQHQLGGHSWALPVQHNGKTFPIDLGVQYIAPMMYPNVYNMIRRPEFRERVPYFWNDALTIGCAYPRQNGQPWNWGNFPDYQQGGNYALYDMGQADARTFQNFLEVALAEGWATHPIADYFDNPTHPYQNKDLFVDYFLWPYLSIINGYGAALMKETIFSDLIPLFMRIPFVKTPLGSFTEPGVGWVRFTNGASSWVQAMVDVAQTYTPVNVLLECTATAVWTDRDDNNMVHVQWQDKEGKGYEDAFHKVVLTTDMWTNSDLLHNENNAYYWNNLYEKHVGYPNPDDPQKAVWPLLPGWCAVHTDESVLSPDMSEQKEALQFTAYYAPTDQYPYYDLYKTYTTYIQKWLVRDPAAEGLYLTMYGYIPDATKGDKMPDKDSIIYSEVWRHGMWTPSFMSDAKKSLHLAQGLGGIAYPGQADTNVYFAGNNVVTDSEEGALDSAMIVANYAFGVPYPMKGIHPVGALMYHVYYHDFMFPEADPGSKLARIQKLHRG